MPVRQQYSYCSYCGHPFVTHQPWPRLCANCHNTTFLNPLPVAVAVVPVDDGLLLLRRGIEPQKGTLAFPGGFIEVGETWQEAVARELFEETGLSVTAAQISELCVHSDPAGYLMVFGLTPPLAGVDLPPFYPSLEATERTVINHAIELGFPLHTEVMRAFFTNK